MCILYSDYQILMQNLTKIFFDNRNLSSQSYGDKILGVQSEALTAHVLYNVHTNMSKEKAKISSLTYTVYYYIHTFA